MQAPKTRNSPSDMAHKTSTTPRVAPGGNSPSDTAHKTSSTTPRVSRQLKIAGGTDSACSSNSASRTPTERSPKITERRSPRSPMSEKKRPSRVSELEFQISQLKEDLKKAKEQLNSSESSRKMVQQEAEETKKELAAVAAKLDESQHQLIELSASQEARVLEFQKISQEKDSSWQSELKVVQDQHSLDSAALAAANVEIQQLKQEIAFAAEQIKHEEEEEERNVFEALKKDLSQAVTLVDDLGDQLQKCRESEAQAHALAGETLHHLQSVNSTIKTLKLEGLNYRESFDSISVQLQEARSKVKSLEEHLSNHLQSRKDKVHVDGKPLTDLEHQLAIEIDIVKQEVEQLRYAIEETETKLHEVEFESMSKIQTAREEVETMQVESKSCMARKMGVSTMRSVESEFRKLHKQLSEMKKNLMDKESELQSIAKENEGLKVYIRNKEQEESDVDISTVLADFETSKSREQEALLKLDAAIEETDKSTRKATRLAEQLEVSQASNAAMEAELRRLRVQTEQWKKAADAATAVLATAHFGKTVERTGSMDSTVYSNIRVGSPFYEDMDESSPRKKNAMLKRFAELWKKKSQHK